MKKDYFLGLSEEGFHRIAYTEWGTPQSSQPPIVCVHGFSRNGSDFDSLANYLSQTGRQLFCPDIVGRGASDWLKDPTHYTYEQYAADMNAMIARTQSLPIDWIGTSMGGLIGMLLASQPNSPIRRLVMNDIGPQIPLKALTRFASYEGSDPEFANVEEAAHFFKSYYTDFGPLSDTEWRNMAEQSIQEKSPGKFTMRFDPHIKRTSTKSKLIWKAILNPAKALEGTFFDVDLWEIWRKVKCPVLVIRGVRSDFLLPSIVQKMQQIHGNVELFEVQDAGHAPALHDRKHQEVIANWLNK